MAKVYDLEDRTLRFSRAVFTFFRSLPSSDTNTESGRQLIRSAASVGANYREANEALGRKDFLMRLRIARKEAKEAQYWLELTECRPEEEDARTRLIDEANQLMRILGSIISKFEGGIPKKLDP
ncbi:MAG: four helix bundle protein [Bacteroidetes bacterium]|jgi:four helix bundle protein|nr:four helix bundle protein [Bacteroidota bacterium]